MARNKVKKEKPPVRLLGTMFLLVLGLVAVYVGMALGIFTLMQRLVHLEDASYTLLWPILILSVSAILGVLLAIFIFRGYLAPLSRLMQATQSVAEGDYTVRVDMRGARGEVAEYIRSFNKMAEELSSVALLRMDFVNTFSHEFKTPLISIRGFAKLLQNDDLTPEQRRTYTDTVVQQSERLAAMSTHVLELARYENTEIVSDKTLYSLDEQLRRCVRQQEREWLKKSLTVEGDLDPVTITAMRSWWSTSGLTCSPTLSGSRPPAGRSPWCCGGVRERSPCLSPIRVSVWTRRHSGTFSTGSTGLRHTRMTGATAWASPLSAGW